jgi:hypothetical protein
MVGPDGIWRLGENFSFSGAFKTYTNPQEGQNQVILIQ